MKSTTLLAIGLMCAGMQTAQAQSQSSEAQKEHCCPGIDATGKATDPCFEFYKRGLIRAEAYGLLSQFKTSVTEHYYNSGTWPAAADPLYVGDPTSYAQNWVSRFDLMANGVMAVTLNRQAGGGSIWLRPVVSPDPKIPLYWRCDSPDLPQIGQLVPGCTYSGRNP